MQFYLRAPFIIALFSISIIISIVAAVPVFKLVDHYELPVRATQGEQVLYLNATGIVRVRGEVPEGVRVYLLSAAQYWDYLRKGELPGEFLGEGGQEELVVEDPFCLLILSELPHEVSFSLHVEVYEQDYRYALLAIPAYFLALVALMLLFMRLAAALRAKAEEGHGGHKEHRK